MYAGLWRWLTVAVLDTYRFNVDSYEKLFNAGIIGEDDRVELLNGEIIVRSPTGFRHTNRVNMLNELLVVEAKGRYLVSPQNPFRLDEHSMLEPDLALVDRSVLRQTRHAEAHEILLAIEVADSSLSYDTGTKLQAYARAGIPEIWIVDLTNDQILVYREPDTVTASYQSTFAVTTGHSTSPLGFPDLLIPVDQIIS
ncbi:MAG: Uma2 family endonuclease [Verrucomicrobia bacterium]|nr:Uma2 family endonuclease [Verrucomicrobiota bacterium]